MEKDRKRPWKNILKSDMITVITGLALMISLVLIYLNPFNKAAILSACIAGALINIQNGVKTLKKPERRASAVSYLMMGIVLIVLGLIITQYVM